MPSRTLVVLAADTNYAGQLAVTLQSIDDTLRTDEQVDAYVLATAIDATLRSRVTANLNRVAVRWIDVGAERFGHLPRRYHISQATYSRLLLDEFIDDERKLAVYLDVDVIVRRSIIDLASSQLEGALFGACVDLGALRLASPMGLPDWRERGLDPAAPYLNAGVLLIDVKRWREEGFGREMIDYLESRGQRTRWVDQDAFNACGCGRWTPLDMRWNVMPYVDPCSSWAAALLPHDELVRAYEDPWIVHFASPSKPWANERAAMPWSDTWWQTARRTAFRFDPPLAVRAVRTAGRGVAAAVQTLFGHR